MDEPADQTHVLWGALVGGPDEKDFHNDQTKDYIYNEVAVDYNAAFVGACAGLYQYYGKAMGNKPVENFPPSEASMKGDIQEIYIDARVMQETDARSQIEISICNDTSLPPRYISTLSARYFFNINEMLKALMIWTLKFTMMKKMPTPTEKAMQRFPSQSNGMITERIMWKSAGMAVHSMEQECSTLA